MTILNKRTKKSIIKADMPNDNTQFFKDNFFTERFNLSHLLKYRLTEELKYGVPVFQYETENGDMIIRSFYILFIRLFKNSIKYKVSYYTINNNNINYVEDLNEKIFNILLPKMTLYNKEKNIKESENTLRLRIFKNIIFNIQIQFGDNDNNKSDLLITQTKNCVLINKGFINKKPENYIYNEINYFNVKINEYLQSNGDIHI